jgi:hypothetical protein
MTNIIIKQMVIDDIRNHTDAALIGDHVDRIVYYFEGLGLDSLSDEELKKEIGNGSAWHLYDFLEFTS